MIDRLLEVNGCRARQADAVGDKTHPLAKGAEVATSIHTHGHQFPIEAPALIVEFFQEHPRP